MRRDVVATNPIPAIAMPAYSPAADEDGEPLTFTEDQVRRLLQRAKDSMHQEGLGSVRGGTSRPIRFWPSSSVLDYESGKLSDCTGPTSARGRPRSPSNGLWSTPTDRPAWSRSRRRVPGFAPCTSPPGYATRWSPTGQASMRGPSRPRAPSSRVVMGTTSDTPVFVAPWPPLPRTPSSPRNQGHRSDLQTNRRHGDRKDQRRRDSVELSPR